MNTQTKPWGAGDLFLLIVLTAFCGFLFITMIPELCAVSFFLSIYTVIGWVAFLNHMKRF